MKKYKKYWICCKNKPCNIDFSLCKPHRLKSMLQFCLILLLLPYFSLAQGIKTKGKVRIKATGCVKLYVKGNVALSDSTILEGKADLQITGSSNIKEDRYLPNGRFETCTPQILEGCQILNKIGNTWTISMSNLDMGLVKVQFFNAYGQVIEEKEFYKKTAFWYQYFDVSTFANSAYIVKLSINNKLICSEKVGKIPKTPKKCLLLYPNPAQDFLFFYFENGYQSKRISYQIVDMLGHILLTQKDVPVSDQESTWKIDIRLLTEGNYILRILDTDFLCHQKFVILRQ